MSGLTIRQAECRDFVAAFEKRRGYTPSYAEIGTALGLKSKHSVARLVDCLVSRGYAHHPHGASRALRLIDRACPHCGGNLKPDTPALKSSEAFQ